MSKEYTCDVCFKVFCDRDFMYPVDGRKDYCGEECFEAAKCLGEIIECPICKSDVTVPHNCPIAYINKRKVADVSEVK